METQQLLETLEECSASANRLLSLLEESREDICGCFGGEPLAAYLQSTCKAQGMVNQIKEELLLLQRKLDSSGLGQ